MKATVQRRSISQRRYQLPPVVFAIATALFGPVAYGLGLATLSDTGIALAAVSFSIAVYLAWVLEPAPPYTRFAMGAFLCYSAGLLLLGAPARFAFIREGLVTRALAIISLSLLLAVVWLLYVHAAQAAITTNQSK